MPAYRLEFVITYQIYNLATSYGQKCKVWGGWHLWWVGFSHTVQVYITT